MQYKILHMGEDEFWVIEQDDYNYDLYYPIQKGIKNQGMAEALVRGLSEN